MKIKEKVLKGMFTKEFLNHDYTPETKLTMDGIKSAIDLTLAEVDKVIGKKIGEYEKHWLKAKKDGDKEAEDIFYNTYSNLEELKKEIEKCQAI